MLLDAFDETLDGFLLESEQNIRQLVNANERLTLVRLAEVLGCRGSHGAGVREKHVRLHRQLLELLDGTPFVSNRIAERRRHLPVGEDCGRELGPGRAEVLATEEVLDEVRDGERVLVVGRDVFGLGQEAGGLLQSPGRAVDSNEPLRHDRKRHYQVGVTRPVGRMAIRGRLRSDGDVRREGDRRRPRSARAGRCRGRR